jgi:uncharacterized protein with HEPN domain
VPLDDVRRATQQILKATDSREASEYVSDDLLRAAVERWFITIGEALFRLEKIDHDLVNQVTDHRRIIGFRNILVHGYDIIDDRIVWQTIQQYLPILLHEVEDLIARLSSS